MKQKGRDSRESLPFLQKISISSIYINYIKNGYFGIVPFLVRIVLQYAVEI